MTRMWAVLGDSTSSGGKVVTGSPFTDIDGNPVARVTDKATCPKHQGTFPIVDGDPTTIIDGHPVALHGSRLACGCAVLAVQQVRVALQAGGSAHAVVGGAGATTASLAPVAGVASSATARLDFGEAVDTHVHSGDGGTHVVDDAKARDVVEASDSALESAGAYRPYASEEEAARTWAGVVLPIANSPEFEVEVGAIITRKSGRYLLGRAYSTGSRTSCDALPERGPRGEGEPVAYIHTHPEPWGFIGRDRAFELGDFPAGRHGIGGANRGPDQSGDLVAAYGLRLNAYIAEPGRLIHWNFNRCVELQERGLYDISPDAQLVRLGEAEGQL